MGREIYTEIRDKNGKAVWNSAEGIDSWVCGRDDATGYIAGLVYAKVNGEEEDSDYSIDITDEMGCEGIASTLHDLVKRDNREVCKAKTELEDLYSARRNARNYEEFASFGERIMEVDSWIQENDYSSAASLLDLLKESRDELAKYPGCSLHLVLSE